MLQEKQQRLPLSIQLGWATGELGIATYVGLTMGFLLFYLTQALNMSPLWAGIALLIPRLWDVVTDPIMGAISDRTNSRMGRRRPYLLAGSLLFGSSFYLIFLTPADASETIKFFYVTGMYLLASTAFTIFDVPYSSMTAEMTADYKERTALVGYKSIAARIGIVLAVLAAPLIFTSGETLASGFELMGLIFGGFMVITGLIAFITTKNAPRIATPLHEFSIRAEFEAIWQNKPFRLLWLVFLLQNLAIGAGATTLIYYVVFVMKVGAALVGPLIATGAITATLATPVWVRIARKLGKRKTYFVALGISLTMSLPAFFIPAELYYLLFFVLVFAGIGDAANQLMPNAMVPDTVEVDELRTGERREGAIFGAWAFCRKLGMAAGAFLVTIGLQAFGFQNSGGDTMEQTEFALLGLRIIYSLVPFSLFLGALLLLKFYDLDEERFNAIKEKIRKR